MGWFPPPIITGVQPRECPDAILVNKMSLMLLMCIIRTLQVLYICDFDGNDALFTDFIEI